MSKALVVVALAGAAALAAWRFWPEPTRPDAPEPAAGDGKGADPEVASSAATEGAPEAAGGAAAMPAGPVRMRSGRRDDSDAEGGDRHAMSEQFAGEARNPEWAAKREAEVDARAQAVLAAAATEAPAGAAPVTVGKAECRASTCRFQLKAGDTRSLARVLEWLGDERGFAGTAEDMLVEAVEKGDDGPRVVNLFLRYNR
ncbi:MAG TPA: hypothetical protein VMZ28_15715 [Kofleriaceae bacterium]|nr:hypothetical protein [Kofleriaceae bacterium]